MNSGKNIIFFINGKIGGGSPQAGAPYWNKPQPGFVDRAVAYFGEGTPYYVVVDFSLFSTVQERIIQGRRWVDCNMKVTNVVYHFIGHSMGCAFAVGMAQQIYQQGGKIGEMILINAYQAREMTALPYASRTVDFQYTDDRVIHLPFIAKNGPIQGAEVIRERSHLRIRRRHRGPVWPRFNEFWDKLEATRTCKE